MFVCHWFWAKLGQARWPDTYHPALCHLLDVGQVALALWRFALRPHMRNAVCSRFRLSDEDAGRWIAFWVAAHDIGKLTPCFQFQGETDELKRCLQGEGFSTDPAGNPHHTLTGTRILGDELTRTGASWAGLPNELARKVAVTIGGHHGTFPTNWDDIAAPLGNALWAESRRHALSELARLFGLAGTPAPSPPSGDQSVWMYLAGLTAVADWIGSNVAFFPPFICPTRTVADAFDADDYFRDSGRRALCALEALGWLHRASPPGAPSTFEQATGIANPRKLQTAIRPLAEDMAKTHSPQLMIVEAPMGEGKTEAAWYVADCWDRCGGQGTYVALPTMATSNQMFDRVGKFLTRTDGKSNLMLLHGKAALNESFEKLKYAARLYDPNGSTTGVVAEGWFAANKKHGLLAPFGVGTIDQSLLAVLQTKHVFVRLFGLAGKCVILDEIHAYDAYMTTLMERLLRWLAALGCPVVLLSATLPADKRLKLLRAYAGATIEEPVPAQYPRVTTVAVGGEPCAIPFEADPTRRKEICLEWVEDAALAGNLKEALAAGGCAAVIRNTVGLAQDTYSRLKEEFAGTDTVVELFHARFPFGRRDEIERSVLRRFGKEGGPAERDKRILVATQVIEQSLDLDFDVMYSDVAPVDLVLQRAGRLHRHERGNRGDPCLRLITPQEKDGKPDFGPSEWVYDSHLLFRSLLVLSGVNGTRREAVHLPVEIENLIEGVYADAEPPTHLSEKEQAHWTTTREEQKADLEREEEEAKVRQIKKPTFSGALARICETLREEDDPSLHPAHQALTRLARPTVQIICLVKGSAGNRSLPHDGSEVATLRVRSHEEGGIDDLKRLVMAELGVSDGRVLRALRDDPRRPTEWEKVGMLERHHLVEFVEGVAVIGDVALKLDNEIGLRVTRAGEEGDE